MWTIAREYYPITQHFSYRRQLEEFCGVVLGLWKCVSIFTQEKNSSEPSAHWSSFQCRSPYGEIKALSVSTMLTSFSVRKEIFLKVTWLFFCIHRIQAHAQVSIPLRKIQMPGLTWWLFPIIKNTWDATSAKWPTPWFTAVCILPFFAGIPVCNLDKAALSAPTWDLRYSIHGAQGKTWWENQEEHSTEADGVSMYEQSKWMLGSVRGLRGRTWPYQCAYSLTVRDLTLENKPWGIHFQRWYVNKGVL